MNKFALNIAIALSICVVSPLFHFLIASGETVDSTNPETPQHRGGGRR